MQVNCSSCGALQNTSESEKCSYCGTNLSINYSINIPSKSNLVKSELYGRNKDQLSFKNRSLSNLNELVDIYSDEEIERVRYLNLNGNKICSLNGISRFTLGFLILSNNNIVSIDELPKLKVEYVSHKAKKQTESLHLDFNNNKDLKSISDNVIERINKVIELQALTLVLIGCPNFEFDCLNKIKFNSILEAESDFNEVEIFVDNQIELPIGLKAMGFESLEDCWVKFTENDEEYTSRCWRLKKKKIEKIKVGEYGSRELDKEKVFEIINTYRNGNNRESAILKTKTLFDVSDSGASTIFDEILATKSLSLNKGKGNSGKTGCFIATATMGDYNHPVVFDLRNFRDQWLLKRNWGVSFTNWYYTHGPKVAGFISDSKVLKILAFVFIIKPLHLITKLIK